MANIGDVVHFEVHRALKKKAFWYASMAPVLIILIVIGISVISSNKANKASEQQALSIAKTSKIAILDDTGLIDEQQLTKQHITIEPSKQAGIAAVKADKLDAFFYYPKNIVQAGIEIYAQDQAISFSSSYNSEASDILNQSVVAKIGTSTHDSQLAQLLETSPIITATSYKNGREVNSLANLIAPGILMITFLALVILMSYLMITSSTEEKENRVAEIILTSIKSQTLILGKILSIFILGAVQIVAIILPLLIAYMLFRSHITLPGGVSLSHIPINLAAVTLGVLFLIGGLGLFTGLLVGLGALFPSAQDAGRYLGLALIWVFVPMYSFTYIVSSPDALIVNVFTYFPLTAPTTALLRNTVGTLSISTALIELIIIYSSATLAILFAVRAFRYGAMEYGRRISIKELIR